MGFGQMALPAADVALPDVVALLASLWPDDCRAAVLEGSAWYLNCVMCDILLQASPCVVHLPPLEASLLTLNPNKPMFDEDDLVANAWAVEAVARASPAAVPDKPFLLQALRQLDALYGHRIWGRKTHGYADLVVAAGDLKGLAGHLRRLWRRSRTSRCPVLNRLKSFLVESPTQGAKSAKLAAKWDRVLGWKGMSHTEPAGGHHSADEAIAQQTMQAKARLE